MRFQEGDSNNSGIPAGAKEVEIVGRGDKAPKSDKYAETIGHIEKSPGLLGILKGFIAGERGGDPDPKRLEREKQQFASAVDLTEKSVHAWGNHSARPDPRETARQSLESAGYSPEEIKKGHLVDKIFELIKKR